MIQRMNNVLIKHSKILFGVITIVIIISFVWFFTPGADGSLLFGQNSNVIAKFGETEVTMGDAERAQKSAMLSQASALYAAYGEKSVEFFSRMGRMGDDQLRILSATLKLAEIQGFAVADSEVREVIKNDPAFQENGKFSSKKYEAFLAVLDEAGYSTEDYENATRDALLIQKFRNSAFVGVTEPTMSEVETDIAPLLFKFSAVTVICNTDEIGKTLAAPTEEELKKEYESNPQAYMSLPASEATIFFINHKDVKVSDLDKKVEENYKAFIDAEKEKKMSAEEIKTAKENFRKIVISEEAETLLKGIVKEAGEKPTAETLKAAADKKGIKLQSASVTDVTLKTAPSALADQNMIFNICMIPEINTLSPVISNKDTAAFAQLTKREDAKQLDFAAAKETVAKQFKTKQTYKKAEEILNAFKADIVSGKVALDKIAEEGKKRGLTVTAEQQSVSSNVEQFHNAYTQALMLDQQFQELQAAAMTGDKKKLEELVPQGVDINQYAMFMQMSISQLLNSLGGFYNQKLGYVSPVSNNSMWVIVKAEKADASQEILKSHQAYLFAQKRSAALMSWEAWYEKEITAAISPYIQKSEQPAPAAE